MKVFGAKKLKDISRLQLTSAAKKLGKTVSKGEKSSIVQTVAVGLLEQNIIKVVGGIDGSNILRKDIIKVGNFSTFCN